MQFDKMSDTLHSMSVASTSCLLMYFYPFSSCFWQANVSSVYCLLVRNVLLIMTQYPLLIFLSLWWIVWHYQLSISQKDLQWCYQMQRWHWGSVLPGYRHWNKLTVLCGKISGTDVVSDLQLQYIQFCGWH